MYDHLFYSLLDSQDFSRASLLLNAGLSPPSSLLHGAVHRGLPADHVAEVLILFGPAVSKALQWRDGNGEAAHDAAVRLGLVDVAEMLKAAGAPAMLPPAYEDRTSSASLMAAIALGKRYKLEPVCTIFKGDKKKKKKCFFLCS